ncbi:hypothetical protein CkaCkLH20_05715 [Colletotrichum karsti]|uniref:Uncharacterized protein n=1 Tax=Colletotrichum karsti TaxID=1095194 RepID=A0A9P6LI15_9PEZI|nr:uncharacterized protein CkaCkLH20_05715 [Colletotrichum karsti]KAF9876869.1 hypothetical protein CkaCkLH20_05715 [Colletotrichum karsti]
MPNPSVHNAPAEVAAVAPASKGPGTCGYVEFPVTTLRFPMIARPWTCPKPEQTCTSSGSYAGCTTPVPTKCLGSSLESGIIASACADDELCWQVMHRYRPNTACYTWLSTQGPSTYTLFECRSTSGIGILLASPTGVSGTPIATSPIYSTISQPSGSQQPPHTPLPTSPQERPNSNGEAPPGAVAASIAGAIAFLGLLAGGVVYLWMWNKKKKKREGTLHRRTSMAISGPFMVSGAPPKVPPPPRGFEMRRFDVGRNASSVYSQEGNEGRVSEGVVPVVGDAPKRPRRSGDEGIWI